MFLVKKMGLEPLDCGSKPPKGWQYMHNSAEIALVHPERECVLSTDKSDSMAAVCAALVRAAKENDRMHYQNA